MPKDVDITDEDGWVLCDGEERPPCTPPSCAKPSYIKASVYDVDLSMRFAPTLESRRVVAHGPDDDSIIERFGQSFRWDLASGHQSIDELEPLRLLGKLNQLWRDCRRQCTITYHCVQSAGELLCLLAQPLLLVLRLRKCRARRRLLRFVLFFQLLQLGLQ